MRLWRRRAGPRPVPSRIERAIRPTPTEIEAARQVIRECDVLDPVDTKPHYTWAEVAMQLSALRGAGSLLSQALMVTQLDLSRVLQKGAGCRCDTCMAHRLDGWFG